MQEYSKLNVLHWHVIDGESFPVVSDRFPLLSAKGAFKPRQKGCKKDSSCVYSQDTIRSIVQHAYARGIRVVAEFDSPGHSKAWGAGYPNATVAGCTHNPDLVPLDVTKPFTHSLVSGFLDEMLLSASASTSARAPTGAGTGAGAGAGASTAALFPDSYVHLGGDEADLSCYENNAAIAQVRLQLTSCHCFGRHQH